jgi:centrin-2/centrin-1
LIRDLGNGKENAKFDETKIDFQEFLEIMIVKMSQKDSNEDIQKAYRLFVDEGRDPKVITKKSLTKVVEDLEEDLTEQQIEQLIFGANNKSIEEKDNIKEEMTVNEAQFIKIISRELNEDKKK